MSQYPVWYPEWGDWYVEYTFEDFEDMINEAMQVVATSRALANEVRYFERDLATLESILIEAINALRSRLLYPDEYEMLAQNIEWFLENKDYFGDGDRFWEFEFTDEWYAWQLLEEVEENDPMFNQDFIDSLLGEGGYDDFLDEWMANLSSAGSPLWDMQHIMEDVFHDLRRVVEELRELAKEAADYIRRKFGEKPLERRWTLEEQEGIADWLETLLGMIDDARTYLPEFEDGAKEAAMDALDYLLDMIREAFERLV